MEQTREAQAPDVDVEVDAGQLPAYEVDWMTVDVGTTTKTVKVPKLVVVMEEEQVEVPFIDIDLPGASEREERTLVVEVEVTEEMHDLQIEEVVARDDQLVVLSSLTPTGQPLDGATKARVSDRLVLMAPDLDVRHIIRGERPVGDWNSQYRFAASRSAVDAELAGGRTLYER